MSTLRSALSVRSALALGVCALLSGCLDPSPPRGLQAGRGGPAGALTLTVPGSQSFTSGNAELSVEEGTGLVRSKLSGAHGAFTTLPVASPKSQQQAAFANLGRAVFLVGGATGAAGSYTSIGDVSVAQILGDGSLSSWAATTPLPVGRHYHRTLAYNQNLYVVGGINQTGGVTSGLQTAILYAPIDASGSSVGAWANAGTLPTDGQLAVAVENKLYIIGWNVSAKPSVSAANINPDGTLGAFAAQTAFTGSRLDFGLAATPQALYVVGGALNGSALLDSQIGILGSGGIQRWVAGPALPKGRVGLTAVVQGGYLFLLGGSVTAPATDLAAPILANGMLGPWVSVPVSTGTACNFDQSYGGQAFAAAGFLYNTNTNPAIQVCRATPSLTAQAIGGTTAFLPGTWIGTPPVFPSARAEVALAVSGRSVAMLGGRNATSTLSDVYYAEMDPSGLLTSPAPSAAGLSTPRAGLAAVVAHAQIYAIGGQDNSGTFLNEILVSSFKEGNSPGTFFGSNNALPGGRAYHAAALFNSNLYVTGGLTQSGLTNETQVSAMAATGALGAFAAASNTFVTPRSGHASFVYNGRLYVVGGDDGSKKLADVQLSTLGADGTPGAFSTAPNALPYARSGHAAFAQNGVLYVIGGQGDTGELNDTQMSQLDASGNPTGWISAGPTFTQGRHRFGAALVNGFFLLAGGWNGATPLADFLYTTSVAPAAVGIWSKLFDLQGVPGSSVDVQLTGSPAANGVVSLDFTTNGAPNSSGPITLGSTTTIGSGRYLWVKLTLDDSQSAVIAGGGERDVSGVALTFTATAAATKLAFTGTSQTVAINACSGAVQVQSLDASNNPLAVASNTTVTLAGSNGVTFYSDSGCTMPIISVQLASGIPSSSAFYFKGPTAATVTLTATASGLSAAAQTETLQPPLNGGAVKMVFSALQPTYNFGDAVAFTVTLQDQSGATATQATVSVTVSLAQNPGGGALSGATTRNAVNGVVSYSLGLDKAGSGYQLQAVASPALTNGTAFSANFDLRAGQIAFSNPSVGGTVGACSGPLLVILRDVTGSTTVAAPAALTAQLTIPFGITLYSDSACRSQLTGALPIAAGALSTPVYFSSAAAGLYAVVFTLNGYGALTEQLGVATTGGGNPDAGGGGPDGGAGSDAGVDVAAHRTLNGFACSTGEGPGGGAGGALAGLSLGLAWLASRRRRAIGKAAPWVLLALLGAAPSALLAEDKQLKPAARQKAPAQDPVLDQPVVATLRLQNRLPDLEKTLLGSAQMVFLTNKVTGAVVEAYPGAQPMSPDSMVRLAQAQGFALEECEGLCAVDTGRRLSADLVITGDLLRFGTSLKIQLKLEDTHTGLVVGEAEVSGGSIDDLDAKLQPGVAQLFKKLIDRRAALEARARTAEEQERKKTEAQERQRQAAEAKAEKRAEQDRELQVERERREQETRLAEARASATGFGGFGLYGGFAWDPKAKALGEEAGLRLGLGAGWSLAGGVVVAPQLAGRVVLAKGLFGTEDFSVSFGLRGFFSPLPEGTVLGGGGGLKLSVPLFQYLTLYGWFAVEAYKTVSETVVAPLLVSGLEIHL